MLITAKKKLVCGLNKDDREFHLKWDFKVIIHFHAGYCKENQESQFLVIESAINFLFII